MKIVIYDSKSGVSFNPNDLLSKGVGGFEVCIVNLASELSRRGHEVTVFNNCNKDGNYRGVNYQHYSHYKANVCDLFIGCESFPRRFNCKYKVNWTERPQSRDALRFNVDKIIVPSEWSKRFLNDPRVQVIANGIESIFFSPNVSRKPHRMFYAGYTGKGGMAVLPQIFKPIKEKYSDAELLVCGDGGLWGQNDKQFNEIYKNLEVAGISYYGNLDNFMIANLMATSGVLINPVGEHHRETFGLVVAQAMACGCIPISSGEGNLTDLIGDNDSVIYGDIREPEWIDEAIDKISCIFDCDEFGLESLRQVYRDKASKFTWERAAIEFEKLI